MSWKSSAGAPETKPEKPPGTANWQVRKSDGTILQFPNLSLFQQWQADGIVSRTDEISRNGHHWRPIIDIPELAGLFDKTSTQDSTASTEADPLPAASPPPLPVEQPTESTQEPQTDSAPEETHVEETEAKLDAEIATSEEAKSLEFPQEEPTPDRPANQLQDVLQGLDSSDDLDPLNLSDKKTLLVPGALAADQNTASTEESNNAATNATTADPAANPAADPTADPTIAPSASEPDAPPPITFQKSAAALLLTDPSEADSPSPEKTVEKPESNDPAPAATEENSESQSNADAVMQALQQAQELIQDADDKPQKSRKNSPMVTVSLLLILVATTVIGAYMIWKRSVDQELEEAEGQVKMTEVASFVGTKPPGEGETEPPADPKASSSEAKAEPVKAQDDPVAIEKDSKSEASEKVDSEQNAEPENEAVDTKEEPAENQKEAGEESVNKAATKPENKTNKTNKINKPKPTPVTTKAEDIDDDSVVDYVPPNRNPDPGTYRGLMAASKVALKRSPARALVYLRKAMERNPRSAEPIAKMGWAYLHMGDATNAIIQFDKARKMNPGYRDTYRGLGRAYEKEGRRTDAISVYERYMAMCGQCSGSRDVTKRLDLLHQTR